MSKRYQYCKIYKGITKMTTDKYIKSYAVIKSKWVSDNLLDAYLPFVVTIIKEKNITDIDETIICQELQTKYNLFLQPAIIRQILSHAMSKKIITNVREKYIANSAELDNYVISENDFDILWDSLLTDFITYSSALSISFDRKNAEENIIKFIDLYDDRVVYNTIGDIDLENNQFVYSWCKYILEIKKINSEKYEFVLALCTANLLKNTLFYTSEHETKQSSLKIYLDTPMIFALLGMDTLERKSSYTFILDRAKQAGMQLCVFDHNFEEATGIMERAAYWATSPSYDASKANKVTEFFHDSCMTEDEIYDFIDEAETELNSLGITKEVSAYLAEEDGFQADEEHLHELIKTEYGNRAIKYTTEEAYDSAIQNDVRSLVMVERKRAGGYSGDLKNSRYIFITTNRVVAKVSKDYASARELSSNKIPTCITADIFGTLLWIEFPEQQENYLSLKMLADCRALLRPTAQMIAQFNIKLDEAYKRGEDGLTEEKFLFLRSHPIVREKLLDVTSGDYSEFTDRTWRDVYDSIESHAKYEGEQRYRAEKSDHEKTKVELSSAQKTIMDRNNELSKANHTIVHKDEELRQATKTIADKDAEIIEKGDKINKQADTFSLIIARIITAAIFGIPYLASCVFIAIIQNDCLNWTIRGISMGAITSILLILLGFLYSKAETCIQKKVRKHLE